MTSLGLERLSQTQLGCRRKVKPEKPIRGRFVIDLDFFGLRDSAVEFLPSVAPTFALVGKIGVSPCVPATCGGQSGQASKSSRLRVLGLRGFGEDIR